MAVTVLCLGCFRYALPLDEDKIYTEIRQLAAGQPEQFTAPLTFVILVDRTPCGKALTETVWWRLWQQSTANSGCGFLFATSRADSTDVVIAVRLDSVYAPVCVLPNCPDTVLALGIPRGYLPLKLLVDRTGAVRRWWSPVIDSAYGARMMRAVDSLTRIEGRQKV